MTVIDDWRYDKIDEIRCSDTLENVKGIVIELFNHLFEYIDDGFDDGGGYDGKD